MEISKEDLDKTARNYHQQDILDDKHIEATCQRYTFDWVFRHIRSGDRVLEMGYGDGLFSAALEAAQLEYEIVEGAISLVSAIRSKYPKAKVWHSLFEEFEPDQTFDVILCTHVLEHITDPIALLQRMKTWLNPGGRIVIIVPNRDSLHRQLAVLMGLQPTRETLGSRDHLVGHVRVYNFEMLISDVEQAGLRVSDKAGFFLKLLPNSMMLSFSDTLLDALNRISPDMPPEMLANIGVIAEWD